MPRKPGDDDVAKEVDRLLRQLPGADPTLQSDPDQPAPRAQAPRPQNSGPRPAVPAPRPAGPTPLQQWGVWGRVAGSAALGIALTQWPYRADCGRSLYGYLAAVLALLLAAGWSAVAAWRYRSAAGHALSLVVGFWGIVLAAEQILPRVGYAADTRIWQCRAAAAPLVRPAAPPLPAATPNTNLVTDSAATRR